MRVLLIYMPVHMSHDSEGMQIMPPISIYYLGSILNNHNIEVRLIDPSKIRKFNPIEKNINKVVDFISEELIDIDFVGLSSNTHNWAMTKFMIELIKELRPNLPTVLGGLHSTYFHEHIIRTTSVDFILRGEAENTLPELINNYDNTERLNRISGLTWKKNDEIIINPKVDKLQACDFVSTPIPLFDRIPDNEYNIIPIATSRGCVYACKFCSIPRKHDWVGFDSAWTINRILETIKTYHEKFSGKNIYLTDDCFTADVKRAKEILNAICTEMPDIRIILEARATDLTDEELLQTLELPNVIRIAIGVECGYDQGLKNIKKGLTIQQLEDSLNRMNEHGLIEKAFLSFIIGFPWESLDDCIRTIDYAASLVKRFQMNIVNLNWLTLLPSQIWDEREYYQIYLSEEVFDNFHYFVNEDYFFKAHPSLTKSSMDYIENVILDYENRGLYLHKS